MEEKEKRTVCLGSCFVPLLRNATQMKAASGAVSLVFPCEPRTDHLCCELLVRWRARKMCHSQQSVRTSSHSALHSGQRLQTLRRRRGQELGKYCKFSLDLRTVAPTANTDEESRSPALASDAPGPANTLNRTGKVPVALNSPAPAGTERPPQTQRAFGRAD